MQDFRQFSPDFVRIVKFGEEVHKKVPEKETATNDS